MLRLDNDDYAKGDDVDPAREPGNGAIVLASYRGHGGRDDFEIVWRREDQSAGQETGSWFEIRIPGFCTHCKTRHELGAPGPSSWGEVLGLDDPEPYGLSQVVLWPGGGQAFHW